MDINLDNSVALVTIADTDYIVESATLADGTLTLAHQPDLPRNITIEVTSSTVSAGTVTVTGVDPHGLVISETLDLADSLTLTGTENFSSITSAVIADLADEDPGDTIIIGVGSNVQLTVGNTRLKSVTVNGGGGTVGSYTIIDNDNGTTANVAVLKAGIAPQTYTYNVVLAVGLRVIMAGDETLTVTYQQ